jgi:hypothetical protein
MTSSHYVSGRRHEPHRDARACEHAQHEDDHAYGRLRRLAWPFAAERWIGHAPGIARYSLSLGSIATAGFARMMERAVHAAGLELKAHPHMLRHLRLRPCPCRCHCVMAECLHTRRDDDRSFRSSHPLRYRRNRKRRLEMRSASRCRSFLPHPTRVAGPTQGTLRPARALCGARGEDQLADRRKSNGFGIRMPSLRLSVGHLS